MTVTHETRRGLSASAIHSILFYSIPFYSILLSVLSVVDASFNHTSGGGKGLHLSIGLHKDGHHYANVVGRLQLSFLKTSSGKLYQGSFSTFQSSSLCRISFPIRVIQYCLYDVQVDSV